MRSKLLIRLLLLWITLAVSLLYLSAQGPAFEWAKKIGQTNKYSGGNSNTLDYSGNIITAGSEGDSSFIVKQNTGGTVLWKVKLNATAVSITTDATGNIYSIGNFTGTQDFDPGVNTTTLSASGNTDIYILKLDASGNFAWAKAISGNETENPDAITIDVKGNIIITGAYTGTVDFDPGSSTVSKTAVGSYDMFILKLSPAGNYNWVQSLGSSDYEYISGVTTDRNRNIIFGSFLVASVDYDPGSNTDIKTANGMGDFCITKFDSSGNYVWCKHFGSTQNDALTSLVADSSDNIYSTGYFQQTLDFDPGTGTVNVTPLGSRSLFVLKLDGSGNYSWVKYFGEAYIYSSSITLDKNKALYITGSFSDTVDFDPGTGTVYAYVNQGVNYKRDSLDIFILKLNQSGNFDWVKTMGGPGMDNGVDIAVDLSGSVFTTGYFSSMTDFNTDSGILALKPTGRYDGFIHKLSNPSSGLKPIGTYKPNCIVYPNPGTGQFNIVLPNQGKNADIAVYNSLGVLVLSNHFNQETIIDLGNMANGIYYITITQAINGRSVMNTIPVIKQ